ncbi:TonB family protein [Undibacterium sp. Ji50W]
MALSIYGTCYANTAENLRLLRNEAHNLFYQQKRMDLAWTFNKQALLEAEKELNSPEQVAALSQQASFYSDLKQIKQEQETVLKMLAIAEKNPTRVAMDLANALSWLAKLYLQQDNDQAAEETMLRVIDILQTTPGNNDANLEFRYESLGEIYMKRKNWEQAEVVLKRAIALNEKREPSGRYMRDSLIQNLATVYRNTNRNELAIEIESKFKKSTKLGVPTISAMSRVGNYKSPVLKADSCQKPVYPSDAVAYKLQGTSHFRFLISDDGKIFAKYILKSSGWQILDDSTFSALSQCQFEPATFNNKPEASWLTYQYIWTSGNQEPDLPPAELLTGSCLSDKYKVVVQDAKQWLVRLRFLIDPQGKTFGIKIEDSSKDTAVDSDIVALLGRCEFKPTVVNGAQVGNSGVVRFARKSDVK